MTTPVHPSEPKAAKNNREVSAPSFATICAPHVTGSLPVDDTSYPFSSMKYAREPLDLEQYGYVEEEYLVSGTARVFEIYTSEGVTPSAATWHARATGTELPYCTRVLVRRPEDGGDTRERSGAGQGDQRGPRAWLSILNASQGYDIEDDWRRAWDYIISNRDIYIGVTSKPINAADLIAFNYERYTALTWGGQLPNITAEPGWNPFQTIAENEEGLAWEILAQVGVWARSGDSFPVPRQLVMMGQSQSGVYANTYLRFFHDVFVSEEVGGTRTPIFDGYLPGVGSTMARTLNQNESVPEGALNITPPGDSQGGAFIPFVLPDAGLDVPVITISSEGDTHLFPVGPSAFAEGDGPMARHWQVAGTPHSDQRSRVIPQSAEMVKAQRLGRSMEGEALERLLIVPLEPVTTAAMTAITRWIEEGVPAAPSVFFEHADNDFVRDGNTVVGGIRYGLLVHPIADFRAAVPDTLVYGDMKLHDAEDVLKRFATFEDYQAACDEVDDGLSEAGYLEPNGRALLHAVERELWDRCMGERSAEWVTPQGEHYL